MRKEIDHRRRTEVLGPEQPNELDTVDDRRAAIGFPFGRMPGRGMFSFRYTSTEVFSQDGNLHVHMRQTQYKDGRLRTEECEGTLEREAYERMAGQAHAYFLNQAIGFARLLLAPFWQDPRRKD